MKKNIKKKTMKYQEKYMNKKHGKNKTNHYEISRKIYELKTWYKRKQTIH